MSDLNAQEKINSGLKSHINPWFFKFIIFSLILIFGITLFYFKDRFFIKKTQKESIINGENGSVENSDNNPFGKFVEEKKEVLGRQKFPELGIVMEHNEELLFITNKDSSGRPRFESPQNKDKFAPEIYDIIEIPAQDSIKYVAGYFQGWEDIPGTIDKYLIIKYPPQNELIKFRVSFEKSNLFSEDISFLMYETSEIDKNGMFIIEPFDAQTSDFISLTFDRVKDVIRKGAYIVVTPYFDPPLYNKKDDSGNYLATLVYIKKR